MRRPGSTPPDLASPNAFIAVGVSVGGSLGALLGVMTGDWYWMPSVLGACIGVGALVGRWARR